MWIALFFYLFFVFYFLSVCLVPAKDLYLGSHFRIPFTWGSWISGIRSKFQINMCFLCHHSCFNVCFCLWIFLHESGFYVFDEFSKSISFSFSHHSSCAVLLDQLRFVECYTQIIVHCFFYWVSVFSSLIYIYIFAKSLFGWWENVELEIFFSTIRLSRIQDLVSSISLFFFFSVKWNAKCLISFFFSFRQFEATKRCKRYLHWFAMYIVDSSFFYQNNFLFGFISMPLCNKVSLAVAVWTCHWYPSWAKQRGS